MVEAVLKDWRTAPIDEALRATLGFLEKLTLAPESVTGADVRPLRALGLGDQAIADAIHVCVLFNVYDRLADAFEFDIPDRAGFEGQATMLLKRGYAM
jgi:alkylhydroperoxidase family enzyme